MSFSIVALPSGVTRITLEGDLDAFTLDRLRPELLGLIRRRPIAVELDLPRLRSVDARGMQVLGAFFAGLVEIECRLTVTGMRDRPLRSRTLLLFDAIVDASRVVN